jgi:small conductance mechanosensitive channel
MPRRRPRPSSLFESRTEVWRQVGLAEEIDRSRARRAQGVTLAVVAAIAAVLVLFSLRDELFPGFESEIRIATVVALLIGGGVLARSLGSGAAPGVYRRLEPGTAGTIGFLVRLAMVVVVAAVALRIAGIDMGTLAVGGALTAVILGLAAQQTLGNLFAGMVLLSTRPFRVGDRVRLVGGLLAGKLEGIVGSLGLFYTTLVSGADRIMIPNSVLLQLAVIPLREPDRVELRGRFGAETTPAEVQERIAEMISVPTRYPPDVAIEEVAGDEVVLRIAATPERAADGAHLAAEVLRAIRGRGDAQ